MKQNLEIEYKTMLTKDEYLYLQQTFFKYGKTHQQINTYYDTTDLELLNHQMMARIRHLGYVQEFTLKVPKSSNSVVEHSFTQDEVLADDKRIVSLLKEFNILNPLRPISKSDTLRTVISTDFGEFALDQTSFDQTVDYEMEFEVFDTEMESEDFFYDFLEKYNINFKPSSAKFLRSLVDFKVIDKLPPKY